MCVGKYNVEHMLQQDILVALRVILVAGVQLTNSQMPGQNINK